jgi:hypothetical protein
VFQIIVNYLRGYSLRVPEDENILLFLREDAEFYGIQSILNILNKYEEEKIIPESEASVSTEDWIKELLENYQYEAETESRAGVWKILSEKRDESAYNKNKEKASEDFNLHKQIAEAAASIIELIAEKKFGYQIEIAENLSEVLSECRDDLVKTRQELLDQKYREHKKPRVNANKYSAEFGMQIMTAIGNIILNLLNVCSSSISLYMD